MLDTFKQFLADGQAWDMYITGAAGTGKTTDLATLIDHCHKNDIPCITAAFTHKACGILREKLPEGANVMTLHKFLNKRPMVNEHATNRKHVSINKQMGEVAKAKILFIDEYSMVGEQDLMDIRAAQDSDYDAVPELKVVWIGDPNQLPPVGDLQAVRPHGKYDIRLTKVYRQANDNPLKNTLAKIVSFIEGADPEPLEPNSNFTREYDIVEGYKQSVEIFEDAVLLAYTNKRVQELNEQVQGYNMPKEGDIVFSPTTKHRYTFCGWLANDYVTQLDRPFGEPLLLGSKFKTLEYLKTQPWIKFAKCTDEDEEEYVFAVIFGHFDFKQISESLKTEAAHSNRDIESEHKGYKAAGWAKANPQTKLARARAKAWRDYFSFNECVICLDFAHAMTVHKSQGSTYTNVFLDLADLAQCANTNYDTYLKLMYVAVSRASEAVYTNV